MIRFRTLMPPFLDMLFREIYKCLTFPKQIVTSFVIYDVHFFRIVLNNYTTLLKGVDITELVKKIQNSFNSLELDKNKLVYFIHRLI
jgi:hypothetical protein